MELDRKIHTFGANVANSVMDGETDGKMLLLHTLTTWGSHVASLVKFCPVVYEEVA